MSASRIVQELSTQVELEYLSSQRYLLLSKGCLNRNMDHLSNFFQTRAQEGVTRMAHLFHYMKNIGAIPCPDEAEQPHLTEFCLDELFEQALQDLRLRLMHLSQLKRTAQEMGDFSTMAFLQQLFTQYRHERDCMLEMQQQRASINLPSPSGRARGSSVYETA
ncbi:hypothetical protein J0B02_01980 [Enterobacteriaceae bacterium YMB-R22]|jgi:ferritin|uniref:ferritin-like domain-containing protein n=1 Tax=Tenebrionicola larvae TaxID=2815733 RepID=UPI0020112D39|nr:ferritin-like domain-containing protein [Tenebrionicola larvae]MBV4411624.1 hypothetical protein [Tenebrionicola larvae]